MDVFSGHFGECFVVCAPAWASWRRRRPRGRPLRIGRWRSSRQKNDPAFSSTSCMRFDRQEARIRTDSARYGERSGRAAGVGSSPRRHPPRCSFFGAPWHDADNVDTAGLAQLVEQLPCKHQVVSSSLTAGTILPESSSPVRHEPRASAARVFGRARESGSRGGAGAFSRFRGGASSSAARVFQPPGARRHRARDRNGSSSHGQA